MAEAAGTEGSDPGTEGSGAPAGGSEGTGQEAKFTQADLEQKIGERLARERAKYEGAAEWKRKAEEFDKLQESQKSELEKAVDKARKDAEATAREETNKTWESRVVRSEIRVAAAGKLADPADAVAFIDASAFKVDEDGKVDDKAIAAAIDELLKAKPHLAANGTRLTRDFDAGSRTPAPGGLSMSDRIRQAAGRT